MIGVRSNPPFAMAVIFSRVSNISRQTPKDCGPADHVLVFLALGGHTCSKVRKNYLDQRDGQGNGGQEQTIGPFNGTSQSKSAESRVPTNNTA